MTSPQYQTLAGLCDTVENLQERLQRRAGHHACTGDAFTDKQVLYVLQPLKTSLTAYRDFHAAQDNGGGQVGFAAREAFFDRIADADEARLKLIALCETTLQRKSTAPGSTTRLSPLFRRMVNKEHEELGTVQQQLHQVIQQDLARVQQMPRHLHLHSING